MQHIVRAHVLARTARRGRALRTASVECRNLSTEEKKGGWIPESKEEMEKIVIRAHMADLEDLHNASASEIVPWFFKRMPDLYFNLVKEDTRMFHLRALTALKDSGAAPELTLHNKERKEVTFIRPGVTERWDASSEDVVEESSTRALNVFKMMTELPEEAAQLSRVHFIR